MTCYLHVWANAAIKAEIDDFDKGLIAPDEGTESLKSSYKIDSITVDDPDIPELDLLSSLPLQKAP
ncbi:hypothetical protein [aff. Roholtiella sp. LEGE 12411]|uniref:hypothetical protein n=1 Tax=aff. Roholtiella sp. LEGE 12411 TaxID=1828822 RepID=UPI00187DFE34|nr:hypothetical protein [aff. Roholtiella sp. LEGE 12411]MBE9034276.1 hypothetical protein [aff. Roholtiella sp. LEGE 12411]